MGNYKLTVSKKTRNIICIWGKAKFLQHYPEYEGSKITQDQILKLFIKHLAGSNYDKFNSDGIRYDNSELW